jgi:hypothetical protein
VDASRPEVIGHLCSHQVTRGKAAYPFRSGQVASRKARPIHVRALIAPPSLRPDGERTHARQPHAGELADAHGIQGMRLLYAEAVAVPPRAPTAPGPDGQIEEPQRLDQGKTRRIDRSSVSQWLPGLGFHFWVPEFAGCPIPFGRVAVVATECENRDTVGATASTRPNMIQFKGSVFAPAVDAPMLEFLQQIAPDLPTEQVASLLLDARYLWVLQERQIKLHAFHIDPRQGNPSAIASRPGQHIPHPAQQRRRKPAVLAFSVGEPGWPVTQVGGSPPSPIACSLQEGVMDCFSAMGEFSQVNGVMDLTCCCLFYPCQHQAGRFRSRIDFEHHGLHRALLHATILESDDKRDIAMHHGSFASKQQPCSSL